MHPGYPNFICGEVGKTPRQPPCGVLDAEGNPVVCPTPLEEANFVENAAPWALYTDTCPCHTTGECSRCGGRGKCCESEEKHEASEPSPEPDEKCGDCEPYHEIDEKCSSCEPCTEPDEKCGSCGPCSETDKTCGDCRKCRKIEKKCENVKAFEIALVQAKLTYNRYGWHDPEGRFFVLKEELERCGGLESYIRLVEEEKIRVEPLVIRANAGDCIELRTTNLLPEYLEANAFQLRTRTDIVGHHVHLVKFDTITSDGAANGWNNIAGARKYETLVERFFCRRRIKNRIFP